MNLDVKNVVSKISKLEATLKQKIESGALFNEVKRFAGGQAKVLTQKVKTSKDVKKLVTLIEQRRKQIEKVAKDLPKDMKAVRSYIDTQKKELERLGNDLVKRAKASKLDAKIRSAIGAKATAKKAGAKKTTVKKTAKVAKGTKKRTAKKV